jgi:outer membrane assembly lipoprotein YfiO
MRPFFKWAVLLYIMAGMAACGGQKGAKLQQSVIPPDKTLYQNGTELLRKSRYTEARLAFQTLIRTYPGSDLQADAYLAMGDSYYQEGGTENLLLAEDQYKNFIIFFPTSPKAPDAQMKVVAILMRQMNSPDRDSHYTKQAEAEISRLLTMFPNSDFVPIAKQYLDVVQENLALGDLGVGDYYSHVRNYLGAESRYREITEQYPHFSKMDEVDFKLAQVYQRMQRTDEAAKYFGLIVAGYPFSKYSDVAKEELQKMGKPIPAVNAEWAARNQALVRPPAPFSPLRPFIDFAEAIGFKGPPDRYEEARKTIEANRAEAVAAAAGQEGAKPKDVLINATITKGSNDKAAVNPNGTQQKTDKKDDKKQDSKKQNVTKKDDKKQDDKTIKKQLGQPL